MTNLILRSELIDWWQQERLRVSEDLEERLDLLLVKIDKKIDDMPSSAFVWRENFKKDHLEPLAVTWIETEYKKQSSAINESFSSQAFSGDTMEHGWSASDITTVGAAAAFSIAPLAALPFLGSVLVTGGLFSTAYIAAIPASVITASAVALGYGPSIRSWASSRLTDSFKQSIHSELRLRILGDYTQPEIASLKGTLLHELDGILQLKLEQIQ